MSRISAVILDLDGTMVDSEGLSRQAWDEYLGAFGHRLEDAVYRRMVGRRSDVSAGILKDTYGLSHSVAEILVGKNRVWERTWRRGLPPMPGLGDLLADLARREVPWGVATSSPRAYGEVVLGHLGVRESCRALVGGDEVTHSKPAPDGYLLAAERMGCAPTGCLAIEDSLPGMEAAVAAGMVVVAIPNAFATGVPLPPGVVQVRSLAAVPAVLDALEEN